MNFKPVTCNKAFKNKFVLLKIHRSVGFQLVQFISNVHPGLAGVQIAPVQNCSFSFYPFELKLSRIVEHEIF